LRHADSSVDANVSEKNTVSIFSPEEGDSMFLRNVVIYGRVYMAPKPRGTSSSYYAVICTGLYSKWNIVKETTNFETLELVYRRNIFVRAFNNLE
jgi:hypothetical protein